MWILGWVGNDTTNKEKLKMVKVNDGGFPADDLREDEMALIGR